MKLLTIEQKTTYNCQAKYVKNCMNPQEKMTATQKTVKRYETHLSKLAIKLRKSKVNLGGNQKSEYWKP